MKSKVNVILCVLVVMAGLLSSCMEQGTGLIPVRNADKWGYINPKGEYVINPQFDGADFFYSGLARVVSTEGKIGYITTEGKYEIAATYKDGTAFYDGLAFVVSEGGHPTCIDTKGNIQFILKEVEKAYAFNEGLAMFANQDDKYGFVDKTGKIVINPQFDEAYSFCEGFAAVMQDEKWGFIDKAGKIVINLQFDEVRSFSEGKAAFSDGKKWGFIDTKGTYVINPQFDDAIPFTEGLALVKQGKMYGYINPKGQFAINPQFDDAFYFENGLASVQQQGKVWGFINKKGQYEVNPQFERVWMFSGNVAPVQSGDKWGFVDKQGKYVINPQFDRIQINMHKVGLWFGRMDYVRSDYYDATEFIGSFFKKDKGTSFDGVDASSTLQDLANHEEYGGNLNANDKYYAANYIKKEITKDISLYKILFHFNTPIYSMVPSYSYYGYYSYQTGTKKEYNFMTQPVAIEYQFDLKISGKAYNKGCAIASAIKTEIEQRQQQKMETENGNYVLYQEDGKLSYLIDYSDYHVSLYVGFTKNGLQKFNNEEDTDIDYEDYYDYY